MTQAELARRLSQAGPPISSATVSNYERGSNQPGVEGVDRIARVLEVSPAWLVSGLGPVALDELLLAGSLTGAGLSGEQIDQILERLSSKALFTLAQRAQAREHREWRKYLEQAKARVDQALQAQTLPDDHRATLERMGRAFADILAGGAGRKLRYRSGPVQREGFVEELEVDYEAKDDADEIDDDRDSDSGDARQLSGE